jgi:hypothetical protein
MKIRLGELRKIIREALSRSPEADLAVIVRESTALNFVGAVVYSAPALIDVVRANAALPPEEQAESVDDLVSAFMDAGVVVGYVKLNKPAEPCNDAWKVIGSWGPGMGAVVYDLALALSPTGRLMSDRFSVSPGARSRWEKISAARGDAAILPLDDEYAPPAKQLTPDEEGDDCELRVPIKRGGPDPLLDRAYVATGDEIAKKEAMVARHEEVMAEVMMIDPDETRKRMEDAIFRVGGTKFADGLTRGA